MTTLRAKRRTLTVTLDAELHARLLAAAARYQERPIELVRRAVDHYLDLIDATEQHLAQLTPRDDEARR